MSGPSTEGLQDYMQEIKSLLEQQVKTMAAQSDQIEKLTAEVGDLKSQLAER